MSKFDQQQLLVSIHPFDLLAQHVIVDISNNMDIAYYPKDTVLISPSIGSEYLYIIIKGSVDEYVEEELHNVYSERDSFDANALIYDDVKSKYVVQEDLICYLLKKEIFLNLIQDYEAFSNYYMQDFISKHQLLKTHQYQNELTPFMMAKVEDIFLHEPCVVDEITSVYTALLQMKALNATAIISEGKAGFGIVTDSDLRDKVLVGDFALTSPVKKVASYPLICIDMEDFLFNALLMFTKHGIKRMAVLKKGEVVGVLEQLDLLSHFANHSHLIAVQVNKAQNIEELSAIGADQLYLVQSLYSKGVKVRYISKLVSELNAKVYEKVYELSVPTELQNKAALVVMGSEGRHEQILRTDQDNALIISDDVDETYFTPHMEQFSKNLEIIGFPPCPGFVMVSNPQWRGSVKSFKSRIDTWVDTSDERTLQELSIFLDAHFICGNEMLLGEVRDHLKKCFISRSDVLAHIAKAVLNFDTPLSMFSGFVVEKKNHENEIDLKKGGIFAIVHGIRTLALEHGVDVTNTSERIKVLKHRGLFEDNFATELLEAYDTLLNTRLKTMLAHPNSLEDANFINPSKLDKFERDLLKDSFKVVNTFKKFLAYHFKLNMVI